MNKFLKIFNVVSLIVFISYVLAFMTNMFSLITIDKVFIAGTCLSTGLLIGIRGFFRARPFYVSRKLEWPTRWSDLFFAALFTWRAVSDLTEPSLLSAVFCVPTLILIPFSMREVSKMMKKQRYQ